jgi:tetratricopeptide (TPR) repeat protein
VTRCRHHSLCFRGRLSGLCSLHVPRSLGEGLGEEIEPLLSRVFWKVGATTMVETSLTYQQARELVQHNGVHGSNKDIERIIDVFGRDPCTLELVAAVLRDRRDGDASELDTPEVLAAILNSLVRSGRLELALQVYHGKRHYRLSLSAGYTDLGLQRSWFLQGLELTSAFLDPLGSYQKQDVSARDPESGLPAVAHERALYLIDLGELADAEAILRSPMINQASESCFLPAAKLNLCDVLTLTGRLSEACHIVETMIDEIELKDIRAWLGFSRSTGALHHFSPGFNPYSRRANMETLQGQVDSALLDFRRAEEFEHKKSLRSGSMESRKSRWWDRLARSKPARLWPGQAGVFYGLLLTRLGMLRTAENVLDYGLRWATRHQLATMVAFVHIALADVYRLLGNDIMAFDLLEQPLSWSAESHQKELACWSHLSLARLYLSTHRLEEAQAALQKALDLAEKHNFVLYGIDCHVTAGRIALLHKDRRVAEENATKAMHAAADPDCSYAWAHGNALHLLAEIYADYCADQAVTARDERDCRKRATLLGREAVTVRERIRDPRVANSRDLLARITP